MTRIIITRHGETDWNRQGRAQGRTDIPLNEKGKQQASRLAERLKDEQIDVIYSSPLSRALETAKIVKKYHPAVDIVLDEDLVEFNCGEMEGKVIGDNWRESMPYEIARWPGSESPREVRERAMRAIDRIVKENPDKSVLVTCHGGVKRMVAMHLRDHTWDEIMEHRFGNTCLSIFSIGKDKIVEELFNCTAHLDDDGVACRG